MFKRSARTTIDGVEESVIDYVIVSSDLINDISELVIDEKKNLALSKIIRGINPINIQSDHNVMLSGYKLSLNQDAGVKSEEIFNLKNRECQF